MSEKVADKVKPNLPTVLMLVTKPVNPDPRVEREAYALSKAGWNVKVIGLHELGGSISIVDDPRGFRILRLPNPRRISSHISSGWISTLLVTIRYYLEALKRLPDLLHDVIVVHSHDFDTLPLGYFLAKISGAQLVYDSHEAFSSMFSKSVPGLITVLVDTIETIFAKRAITITVGQLLAERFKRMTGKMAKIIRNAPCGWSIETSRSENEKFVVGYVGGLLHDRCMLELIDGFESFYNSHPTSELRIAGFGPMEEQVQQRIAVSSSQISFHGKIPYSEVPNFLSQVSVSVILFSRHNENNYYSSPNKLFESSYMGVPVLASNFGELGWLVKRYGLGFIVDPDDAADITRMLVEIYNERENLTEIGQKARENAITNFSCENAMKQLIAIYVRLSYSQGCEK